MSNQGKKTQREQQDATKSSKWGNVLSGFIFIVTILFILGFFCVLQGFTAELLSRTYHESQGKPTYIVRQVYRSSH